MNSALAGTTRRLGFAVALVGATALGSVTVASAASAAAVNDGPAYIVDGPGDNGPDKFIVTEHGRIPVFFCDADKPNQRHDNCITISPHGNRF